MNFTYIRTFLTVADQGGFAAAAAELNTVQSNVTTRISRLEAEFSQKLFHRGKGGAQLTPFGRSAYDRLSGLCRHVDEIDRELKDLASGSGSLRLGSMETTAATRLPHLLKQLRSQAPSAQISLTTGTTGELFTQVWDRKLDAAFVAAPVDEERFRSLPAFQETLAVAYASQTGLAGPLLSFRRGCAYRATAEAWLKAEGRLGTEVMELGSLDGMIGCVAAEMGFTVAPVQALNDSKVAHMLTIEPLTPPYHETQTLLIFRHDYHPVKAARVLEDLLGDGS